METVRVWKKDRATIYRFSNGDITYVTFYEIKQNTFRHEFVANCCAMHLNGQASTKATALSALETVLQNFLSKLLLMEDYENFLYTVFRWPHPTVQPLEQVTAEIHRAQRDGHCMLVHIKKATMHEVA